MQPLRDRLDYDETITTPARSTKMGLKHQKQQEKHIEETRKAAHWFQN